MTIEMLREMMKNTPDCEITVVGDYCLDKYLYIDPRKDEISLETGLTAYQVIGKGVFPGAAGTVTNNLRGLTARVRCIGVIGDDGEGFELRRELESIGADTRGLIKDAGRSTPTYTKPMRGQFGDYTELNRLDFKNFEPMCSETEAKVIEKIRESAETSRALLVLDQFIEPDCNVINTNVRNAIIETARANPELVVYADSRAYIDLFTDVIVKCNNFEVVKSVKPEFEGIPDESVVLESGLELFKKNGRPVFVTRGEQGITVFDNTGIHDSKALAVPGPFDICGAGDAASSGIVLALSLGASPSDAALLGNIVASITIQQIGVTGFANPEQVLNRFRDYFM